MVAFLKLNKSNINVINSNFNKKKINYFFFNFKYIIYINIDNMNYIKNKLFYYNIFSIFLKKNQIKSIFTIPFFSFLND